MKNGGINMSDDRFVYDYQFDIDKIKISDTGEVHTEPDKPYKRINPKTKIIIISVASLLAVVAVIVLVFFFRKDKALIKLDETCYECMLNGYDGTGQLIVVPDYTNIYNSSIKVIRDKAKALGVDENELFKEFFSNISIYSDIKSDLKNGDKVIITIYMKEHYQEELGIKFENKEYTYMVDSLEAMTEVDPFDRMKIYANELIETDPINGYFFLYENGYCGLTQSDFEESYIGGEDGVTLRISDISLSRLIRNGYKVINSEYKVDLDDIDGMLVMGFDDISQYSLNALKTRAEATIKNSYLSYIPETITYHSGMLCIYRGGTIGNRLNLIYEVNVAGRTLYVNVTYDNLVIEDGPNVIVRGEGPYIDFSEKTLLVKTGEYIYGGLSPDIYAVDAHISSAIIDKDFDNEGIITMDYLEEKYGNN